MLRPLAIKINRMQTAGLQFPMHQLLNGIYPTTPSLFQNRPQLVLPTEISREEKPAESEPSLEEKSEATATSEVYANNSVGTAAMEQCNYSTMKRVFLKQLFQTDEVFFSYKKDNLDSILKEVNDIISTIVGMEGLKLQLRKWIKGVVLHERRKELELEVGTRKPLHMAFLGNPGTGKTMVARLIANILYKLGQISKDKVVEVQRTDLVGEYIGETGPKTRKKVREAGGGILFVDEAYRLMESSSDMDYGIEALEEIMSAMEGGEIVVIFAGYTKNMQRVLNANPGFARRVTKFFDFDDYSPTDIATILHSKMNNHKEDDFTYGFMLHPDCTVEAIAELIKEQLSGKQISKLNGGLVNPLLVNALENLDLRTDVGVSDGNSLLTITMEDLKQGFKCLTSIKQKEL